MNLETRRLLGIDESWASFFETNSTLLQDIVEQIDAKGPFVPNKSNVFKIFKLPINEIKVVILGMDPYPNDLATGIAFGIPKSKRASSLDIIIDELVNYTGCLTIDRDFDVTLNSWVNQGIFLLNSALTVRKHDIGSHRSIWRPFTNNLLSFINDNTSGIIFCFWGTAAKSFHKNIDESLHYKLFEVHPNSDFYSAKNQFVGSKIFEKIDKILWKNTKQKIQWV